MTESPSKTDPVATFLSKPREEELADFADWLANQYFPGQTVKPAQLAARKDIGVSYNDYGDAFDGLLEHGERGFHIFCNTARSSTPERLRFTLAHELGHYFIDEHRNALTSGQVGPHSSYCDFRSKNPVEREADCFASNLLMPPSRVARELRGRDISLASALHLAANFSTSRTSAALRLVGLDRAPCALVLWQDGRFLWKRLSESARRAGLRSRLADASSIPTDSATGRVIAAESPADAPPLRSATTAAMWFQGISHGARTNHILREEAVAIGRFGILTLLVLDT